MATFNMKLYYLAHPTYFWARGVLISKHSSVIFILLACILIGCNSKHQTSPWDNYSPTQVQQEVQIDPLQIKVNALSKYVADFRQKPFLSSITAISILPSEINKVLDSISLAAEEMSQTKYYNLLAHYYLGLGYIKSTTDFIDSVLQTNEDAIAGFYPHHSNVLYVVTRYSTDSIDDNATIVHELTHALQEQQFGSIIYNDISTWDEMFTIKYLVEGEASYVSDNYYCSQHNINPVFRSWPLTIFRNTILNYGQLNPECYVLPMAHIYYQGPYLIDRIKTTHGWSGVDNLNYHPLFSTKQCLHDDQLFSASYFTKFNWNTYFSGMQDSIFAIDNLGELHIATLFSSNGFSNFDSIASGWNGDMFWIFMDTTTNRNTFLWNTAWDTPIDAQEFYKAYHNLLPIKRKDIVVSDSLTGQSYTFLDTVSKRVSFLKVEGNAVYVLENIKESSINTNLTELKSSKIGTSMTKQSSMRSRKIKWMRPFDAWLIKKNKMVNKNR